MTNKAYRDLASNLQHKFDSLVMGLYNVARLSKPSLYNTNGCIDFDFNNVHHAYLKVYAYFNDDQYVVYINDNYNIGIEEIDVKKFFIELKNILAGKVSNLQYFHLTD